MPKTFGVEIPSARPFVIVPEFREVQATGAAAYRRLFELETSRWRRLIGKRKELYDRGLSFGDLRVEEFRLYMALSARWDQIGPSLFDHVVVLLLAVLAERLPHAVCTRCTDKALVRLESLKGPAFLLEVERTKDELFRLVLFGPAGADLAFALAERLGLATTPAHYAHERPALPFGTSM